MALPTVPPQIKTYGDLKNAVELWADRDDDEFVAQIPNFINFAEKEIYRTLRTPPVEREEYLEIKNGIAFVPVDMLEVRYIMNLTTGNTARVTSLEELNWLKRHLNTHTTNFNHEEIVFARAAGRYFFYPALNAAIPATDADVTDSTMVIGYYADTPELFDDRDTNQLLTLAPELILYQALKHACLFVQDDTGAQKWGYMAQAAMAEMQDQAKKAEYSGSPLVIPNTYGVDTSSYTHFGVVRF